MSLILRRTREWMGTDGEVERGKDEVKRRWRKYFKGLLNGLDEEWQIWGVWLREILQLKFLKKGGDGVID